MSDYYMTSINNQYIYGTTNKLNIVVYTSLPQREKVTCEG